MNTRVVSAVRPDVFCRALRVANTAAPMTAEWMMRDGTLPLNRLAPIFRSDSMSANAMAVLRCSEMKHGRRFVGRHLLSSLQKNQTPERGSWLRGVLCAECQGLRGRAACAAMIRMRSALVQGCQPCGFMGRPKPNSASAGGVARLRNSSRRYTARLR